MLPQPSDGFEWVQAAPGPALACRALEPYAAHLFTTRGWQLGSTAPGSLEGGWREVAAAIGVGPDALVRVHQVHGTAVHFASGNGHARLAPGSAGTLAPADIIIGRDRDVALAVQTADCVPVLLADQTTAVVAAVHAGWRGLAAGAPREAVRALQDRFGVQPVNLVAAIGPAIGACCYQVGPDVREAFSRGGFTPEQVDAWFSPTPRRLPNNPPMSSILPDPQPERWFFDGWDAARAQLEGAGVPRDHIFTAALCTASHPHLFCSYRRDGAPAGRLGAVVRSR